MNEPSQIRGQAIQERAALGVGPVEELSIETVSAEVSEPVAVSWDMRHLNLSVAGDVSQPGCALWAQAVRCEPTHHDREPCERLNRR